MKTSSRSIRGTALDEGPRTTSPGVLRDCGTNGWCIGGPFIGFHLSRDQGKTWDYGAGIDIVDASEEHNIFKQKWPGDEDPFLLNSRVRAVAWTDRREEKITKGEKIQVEGEGEKEALAQ